MPDTLLLSHPSDHVLTITLNRPDRRNAFNTRMAEELIETFATVSAKGSSEVRAVVLTGAGDRAFCAGADLKERHGMDEIAWRAQHRLFEDMAKAIRTCPIPIVAAVEGAAFAGGFELVLSCAFAYASETARFALTEVTLGIMPGIGGTQLLTRRAGAARANEIILTGTAFSAAEARDWGIVNRLCPPGEVLSAAEDTAARIARNAPLSVRGAHGAMRDGASLPLEEAVMVELEAYNRLIDTEDRVEGIRAFNEKRSPTFKGA
jgi:enoyl-CoA hydratase